MNRPLNFLHLTTFYPPYSFGGDAMYLYRLAHTLGDLGDALGSNRVASERTTELESS